MRGTSKLVSRQFISHSKLTDFVISTNINGHNYKDFDNMFILGISSVIY
jgi:hypothetical protein